MSKKQALTSVDLESEQRINDFIRDYRSIEELQLWSSKCGSIQFLFVLKGYYKDRETCWHYD